MMTDFKRNEYNKQYNLTDFLNGQIAQIHVVCFTKLSQIGCFTKLSQIGCFTKLSQIHVVCFTKLSQIGYFTELSQFCLQFLWLYTL